MKCKELESDWLIDGWKRVIGSSVSILFWEDIWRGSRSFMLTFPRLYRLTPKKDDLLSHTECWEAGLWRHKLFVWEDELLVNLKNLVIQTPLVSI